MIVFGLPGTTGNLAADGGAIHTDPAGDLCVRVAQIEELLDLDTVCKGEVAVMCGQGSAALQYVV